MTLATILQSCNFCEVENIKGFCEVLANEHFFELIGDHTIYGLYGFRVAIPINNLLAAEPSLDDGTWLVDDIDGDRHAITPFALVRYDRIERLREITDEL